MISQDTIVALATAPGTGAIAVIRVSGPDAISTTSQVFEPVRGGSLTKASSHTVHLGYLKEDGRTLDQVLVTVFKGPNSYTGEHVTEISCHGSPYIQQEIIQLFLRKGCRMAEAGEFTLRAFLNGKLDLSQAEAVADLIASENAASHQLALQQMRGGFSNEIKNLRQELLNFASLIELELDFAEEDVEFADKKQFSELLTRIQQVFRNLIDSFALGNVIKTGIPIAIVGEPNVGKSTLLNALLNEERAIVSPIPGTTRDTVEDELVIGGIGFRFIDTAGIRETVDVVESIGIRKTHEKIENARLVIYLVDAKEVNLTQEKRKEVQGRLALLKDQYPGKEMLLVVNKVDALEDGVLSRLTEEIPNALFISAKENKGLDTLKDQFLNLVNTGALTSGDTIISNTRHYNALIRATEEIRKVQEGLESGLSGDLLAVDIRQALYHLGEITGEITTDDLLGNIFANFCIGK
ncbi:tRNA modification GTPase [Muriicola jejuensis]|uniref:tRNA modification GTPase MnmE n=1 Tax=Muriicola jejuensis TaxID=504488 RepID=A0A6P0UGE2_9FLAO|nr:tRNA uridine-5-carboxymethylaminomethyl(34) synthesis GTPase MnmE [Muriicola jejuensis]NER11510.1 tRNA uridine-5-carboxymethylaminomethyl(34) synthesis GTPase MnmE [Muriicola jejuensis]SMP20246.1 tRNA modification GTPase [Muriicola jejuensis]